MGEARGTSGVQVCALMCLFVGHFRCTKVSCRTVCCVSQEVTGRRSVSALQGSCMQAPILLLAKAAMCAAF